MSSSLFIPVHQAKEIVANMANLQPTIDYTNDFDPDWYLDAYYRSPEGQKEEGNFLKFALGNIHQILESGVICNGRLLDVGTGPSIHSVIEASDHVTELYLSDISEVNRKVLYDWLRGERELQTEMFQYVLGNVHSEKTVKEKQDELRTKVKGIFHIDLKKDQPLSENPDVAPFDVIMSSLCLEATGQAIETYETCAKNMTSLLKPGGHLILIGVLNQSFYRVADFKFGCVKISASEIQRVYTELNYDIIKFEIMKWKNEDNSYSDFEDCFIMLARKR